MPNSLETQKDLELAFRSQLENFLINPFFCNMTETGQIDCVYLQTYSVKCLSCFMLRHLDHEI